jgi:hypothetical protein
MRNMAPGEQTEESPRVVQSQKLDGLLQWLLLAQFVNTDNWPVVRGTGVVFVVLASLYSIPVEIEKIGALYNHEASAPILPGTPKESFSTR